MSQPPKQSVALSGKVITPAQMAHAASRAEAERERLREEGHKEGHAKGVAHARRFRDIAMIAIGFLIGFVIAAVLMTSAYQSGAYTAGAVVDQVLGRTVAPPASTLPPPELTPRDPAGEYERNLERAREGCTEAQLRAGRRNCR